MSSSSWFRVVAMACFFVIGCTGSNKGNGAQTIPAYIEIGAAGCRDSVGINGRWQLVKIRADGKNEAPASKIILQVKDCSVLEYFSADQLIKRDSFKLYRVLNYCADYQLNYLSRNDSISCINMRKDTLIFGDCSTFESARYFYKKLK